jgi:hypothetical protein
MRDSELTHEVITKNLFINSILWKIFDPHFFGITIGDMIEIIGLPI